MTDTACYAGVGCCGGNIKVVHRTAADLHIVSLDITDKAACVVCADYGFHGGGACYRAVCNNRCALDLTDKAAGIHSTACNADALDVAVADCAAHCNAYKTSGVVTVACNSDIIYVEILDDRRGCNLAEEASVVGGRRNVNARDREALTVKGAAILSIVIADWCPHFVVQVDVSCQPAVDVSVVIVYNLIAEPGKLRTVTDKIVTV